MLPFYPFKVCFRWPGIQFPNYPHTPSSDLSISQSLLHCSESESSLIIIIIFYIQFTYSHPVDRLPSHTSGNSVRIPRPVPSLVAAGGARIRSSMKRPLLPPTPIPAPPNIGFPSSRTRLRRSWNPNSCRQVCGLRNLSLRSFSLGASSGVPSRSGLKSSVLAFGNWNGYSIIRAVTFAGDSLEAQSSTGGR